MNKKNFNEVLKQRELEEAGKASDDGKMSLDSTERVKVLSPGQLVFKRFINNKLAIVGSVVLIFMFVFAFIIPLFYPYSQTQIFYKYDKSIVNYAMASERAEYPLLQLEGTIELHYTVKNFLTGAIKDIQATGSGEKILEDENGVSYLVKEFNENIYTLSTAPRTEIGTLTGELKYADYNGILKALTYAPGCAEIEGFEEALTGAVASGQTEFTLNDTAFSIVAGKKQTYTVYAMDGGFSYVSTALGEEFEAAVEANIENGSFTHKGKDYSVVETADGYTVYQMGRQQVIGYMTNFVFDAYEDSFEVSDEFKLNAVMAAVEGTNFTADGKEYKVVTDEEETYVYAIADETTPVAVMSSMVIRNYDGTDTLEFVFKEKVHDVVESMQDSNLLETTFMWDIAQVDSNGEYTLDASGNPIKEPTEVKIVLKNGSYVMSCPTTTYLIDIFAKPSKTHWFGTDGDGMDVLARMMYGGRVSLIFCFITIFIEMVLGVIMGGIAGFFGGWVDNIIMRAVDIFYCIPSMPILIILGSVFDALKMEPYTRVAWMMVVLGVLGWAGVARMVRGQILSLREQEFMVAAESIGLKTRRRIFKHLVPNVMPQLIVTASSGLGGIIITESTLSFLGLGVKHPLATWGTMINSVSTAEAMVRYTYIWIPVGLLICFTVIAFNFVGDGLRDAFDPKMKR